MIYRIDADLNGTETIDHLIKDGLVINIPCRDFKTFDKAVQTLASKVKAEDTVIVDTINRAVEQFLYWQFVGLRLKPGQTPSDLPDISNPSNTLNIYGQIPYYVVEPLRGMPCQLILLAQETEKFFNAETGRLTKWDKESATGALADLIPPEGLVLGASARLSAAALKAVADMTSDTFRISRLMEKKEETIDGKKYTFRPGTRVLNVSDTVAILAKVHVAVEQYRKLRDNLYEPTLPRLYRMLGLTPRVILFYGPQGVGKTTLACSVAEDDYKKKNTKKEVAEKNVSQP